MTGLSEKIIRSHFGNSIPSEDKSFGGSKVLLDLGTQPIVNSLKDSAEEALAAEQFPIRALIDDDLLIHLDVSVPPEKLYADYLYHSGVNKPYIRHCRRMWQDIKHLNPTRIIDIGGNDGTLLKTFQEEAGRPLEMYNVDASNSFAEENQEKGIHFVNEFWSKDAPVPTADFIITTNAFQHTPDAEKFVEGIAAKLDGTWILEFPYTLRTLETLQFDQFYHEHYYYWLIKPLKKLLSKFGLNIFHCEEVSIHGGSMRCWITNKDQYGTTEADQKFIKKEENFDYNRFMSLVWSKIIKDQAFISKLDGSIALFGAAAKGCVYLNALNSWKLSHAYCVDDTVQKQGKYIPGTEIEIRTREYLMVDKPDNIIIMAHNFAPAIAQSLINDGYKGRLITMLPDIQIDRA